MAPPTIDRYTQALELALDAARRARLAARWATVSVVACLLQSAILVGIVAGWW